MMYPRKVSISIFHLVVMVDSSHYSLFSNHPPELVVPLSASKPSVSFLAENLSLTTDISRPDLGTSTGTEFAQHVPLIFAKIL